MDIDFDLRFCVDVLEPHSRLSHDELEHVLSDMPEDYQQVIHATLLIPLHELETHQGNKSFYRRFSATMAGLSLTSLIGLITGLSNSSNPQALIFAVPLAVLAVGAGSSSIMSLRASFLHHSGFAKAAIQDALSMIERYRETDSIFPIVFEREFTSRSQAQGPL